QPVGIRRAAEWKRRGEGGGGMPPSGAVPCRFCPNARRTCRGRALWSRPVACTFGHGCPSAREGRSTRPASHGGRFAFGRVRCHRSGAVGGLPGGGNCHLWAEKARSPSA